MRYLYMLHSSASRNLSRDDGREAAKLCEMMKDLLWSKAKSLVAASAGRPVLYSYGSDGTPMLTRESMALKPADGQVLYRRMKEAGEYLVERGFILTPNAGGGYSKACLLRDPRHLGDGKTALHSFKAATEFFHPFVGWAMMPLQSATTLSTAHSIVHAAGC